MSLLGKDRTLLLTVVVLPAFTPQQLLRITPPDRNHHGLVRRVSVLIQAGVERWLCAGVTAAQDAGVWGRVRTCDKFTLQDVCVLVRPFFPRYLTESHCKNFYSRSPVSKSIIKWVCFPLCTPSLKIISLNKIRHQNENDI